MRRIWRAFWSPRAQYVFLAVLVLLAGVAFTVAGLGSGSAFGTVIGILGLLVIALELVFGIRSFIRWRRLRGEYTEDPDSTEEPQPLSWQTFE